MSDYRVRHSLIRACLVHPATTIRPALCGLSPVRRHGHLPDRAIGRLTRVAARRRGRAPLLFTAAAKLFGKVTLVRGGDFGCGRRSPAHEVIASCSSDCLSIWGSASFWRPHCLQGHSAAMSMIDSNQVKKSGKSSVARVDTPTQSTAPKNRVRYFFWNRGFRSG